MPRVLFVTRLPTRTAGYDYPWAPADGGRCSLVDGSDMTEPEKEDPLSRANELEIIVDDLDEKVADEREAEGVPGKPSDREDAAAGHISENEPPD